VKREEWDCVREITLHIPRSVKQEGDEVLKTLEQRVFPCSSSWRLWWGSLSPAVHGGPWWSRSLPVAHGRDPMPEQVDAWRKLWPHGKPMLEQVPARTCRPVERGAHAKAGLLAGLVTPRGTHAGATCSWRTAPHGKGPTLGHFVKSCSPWEGLTLEKFVKNCLPWEAPHAGAREKCKESSPWGEQSSRDNMWWTDWHPHSPSPWAAWREGRRETGVKLSLGRREGWGEGVWRSGFISHYPTLIWLMMNWTPFSPQVQSVLSVLVIGEWSLPVLISSLFIIFPLPCPSEEVEW